MLFGRLPCVLKNRRITVNLRTRVYNTCIIPVFRYDAQTCTRQNIQKKLRKVPGTNECAMLGITANSLIREKTKVKNVNKHAAKLKWKWAGHNERQQDERWNKAIQSHTTANEKEEDHICDKEITSRDRRTMAFIQILLRIYINCKLNKIK